MEERLQKLIAHAGLASRREAEAMIEQGRVTVNGNRATIGDKADPEKDDIRVDGARLRIEEKRIYIALYKPMGVVTTVRAQEQEHRRTVRELIPLEGHLYPVGRLDVDSEGLILMTNDGELAQKLSHPRYEHDKIYEVTLNGMVPEDVLDTWRRGVVLEDGLTKPVDIRVISREKDHTIVAITMREGRKRQIRRIANMFGYPVRRLVRTEFDKLKLGRLRSGEWRYLSDSEVKILQESATSKPYPRKSVRISEKRSGDRAPTRRSPETIAGRGQRTERRERSERGDYSERPQSNRYSRSERFERSDRDERPRRARPISHSDSRERDDRPKRRRDVEPSSDERPRDERPRRARPASRSDNWEHTERPPRNRDVERSDDERQRDERPRRARPATRTENRERTEQPRRTTRPGERTGRTERSTRSERGTSGRSGNAGNSGNRRSRPARPGSGSTKPRRSPTRRKPE